MQYSGVGETEASTLAHPVPPSWLSDPPSLNPLPSVPGLSVTEVVPSLASGLG